MMTPVRAEEVPSRAPRGSDTLNQEATPAAITA